MVTEINHVGVILDGNRRWAKAHKLQSVMGGHEVGGDKFIDFCDWCKDYGVKHVSAFMFSTDNWNRSAYETNGILGVIEKFCNEKYQLLLDNDIKFRFVGDLSRLSENMQQCLHKLEERSANGKSRMINGAVSYGGRDEYVRVAKNIALDVKAGKLDPETIDEATVKKYLDIGDVPDIDILIRTGGGRRLSGFFPWQTAYSELYFTDTLWGDFDRPEFDTIMNDYIKNTKINMGK